MGGRERAQDHSNGTASDNSAHTSQPGMPKTGTSGMPDQAPRCVAGGCSGARQPPRTVARPTRSARRTMQRRCGAAGGMTFLRRDSPFTQTTRRPARRLGRDRAGGWTVRNDGLNRTVSDAYSSGTTAATTAIDLGAAANQDGLAADDGGGGKLGSAQHSHQAAAAGHPAREEGRCGGRAFSPRLPPRAAAPARLAAWSVGRAPHAGHPRPTDRGLETAPDARALSYLWVRNPVNTVVTR
jgi:hypothetical protein